MFDNVILKKIKDNLIERNETISVAESVTSGLLGTALSTAPDAMKFFQGGFIVYNIGQKARHLSINPIHAIECNCVSRKMAEDMALSICKQFSSDWGVAITGYASPVRESGNSVFAFIGVAYKGKIIHVDEINSEKQEPFDVQMLYVNNALKSVLIALNHNI